MKKYKAGTWFILRDPWNKTESHLKPEEPYMLAITASCKWQLIALTNGNRWAFEPLTSFNFEVTEEQLLDYVNRNREDPEDQCTLEEIPDIAYYLFRTYLK